MKITVFSDSHGAVELMLRAAERSRPDMFIHLGDHIRDSEALKEKFPHTPVRAVKGNCDLSSRGRDTDILFLDGVKTLIAHGHRQSVKSGLARLAESAAQSRVSLALYGHTHIPRYDVIGGIALLNPGAIGDWSEPSFAEIFTDGDSYNFKIEYF